MRRTRWLLPACLLLLMARGPASAADFRFQSSTQYLWYTDPFQNKDESDVLQYVKLDASSLDADKRTSVSGYGRLSKQFGSDKIQALGDDTDLLGRLYYLYFNYAFPSERGAFRLGRQYVVNVAGAGTIDGLRLEVKPAAPLTLSAFAGYEIRFAPTTDRSGQGDYLVGASAGASVFKGNNIELSWLRRYNEGDIVREMFGLHVDQTVSGKGKAYVDWRYDYLHGANGEFLGGLKVSAIPGLVTLTGEYFEAYPNFDADSIYTAFAVTRFKEATGRVDWFQGPQLTLFASYAHDSYEGPRADVVTVGASARPSAIKGLGLNGSYVHRSGYPGSLDGFQLAADYAIAGKALVAAGLTWDVFQRDSMSDDFTAKQYWVAGSYAVAKNMSARLRVQDTVTRLFENEYQGRASVDLSF